MQLREYQIEAVEDLFDHLDPATPENPLIALPTGTGKSLCIAATVKRTLMETPGAKIIKATHSQQLVMQNEKTLRAFMPMLRTGVYCSALKRKEVDAPVIYGSIQSMVNAVDKFGFVDRMLVDEAHLIPQSGMGQYRKFINGLRKVNPELQVIGFTATPYRLGLGSLLNADVFDVLAHDATDPASFRRFIRDGWLCPLIPKATDYVLDVEGVGMRGGDYIQSQLATAVDDKGKTLTALTEACDLAANTRDKWLVFTASIAHSEHVTEILNAMGVSAVALHSKTKGSRDEVLGQFTSGPVQALVSCDMMTTGFDYPPADCIVMLRPTMSTGLWVQMLGRGTRPYHSKENCLVLDFAGNTAKLGPIDAPLLPKQKGKGGGTAPVKICDDCRTYNHASARTCFVCGFEFPQRSFVVFDTAEAKAPMAAVAAVTEVLKVRNMSYRLHKKPGRPNSLRVTYQCGLIPINEWVCLEHAGKPQKQAHKWWAQHSLDNEIPATVEDAMKSLKVLRQPHSIEISRRGKWTDVTRCIFDEEDVA